jgi:Holliday junction resolvasome RuvABC endonuclease subunit
MILGIDYSTVRAGVSVIDSKGNLVAYETVLLDNPHLSHKQKRKYLIKSIKHLIEGLPVKIAVIESVRLFHHSFISMKTIYALIAVSTAIVDNLDIQVYTIDTRSWKKGVLGSAKATKEDSVRFVKRKYGIDVDHDLADSVCIARCVLNPHCRKLLKKAN